MKELFVKIGLAVSFIFMVIVLCTIGIGIAKGQTAPATSNSSASSYTFSIPPPPPVQGVNAQVVGLPGNGNIQYAYFVIAKYNIGNSTNSQQPALVFNTPNTLTGSNYVQINWQPVTNAIGYDVIRQTIQSNGNNQSIQFQVSCTNCLIASNILPNTYQDISNTTLGNYTLVSVGGSTISFSIDNTVGQYPHLNLTASQFSTLFPNSSIKIDFTNAGETQPFMKVLTLPTTCTVYDVVWLIGAVPPLYACTSTNVFTSLATGSSPTGSAGAGTAIVNNFAGAAANGVILTDAVISSGSNVLTSALSTFTPADVGKLIQVYGANSASTIGVPLYDQSNCVWGATPCPAAGLNNVTAGGTYTGQGNTGYYVCILAGGASFSWGFWNNNFTPPVCTNGAASVAITGGAQTLNQGVTFTFGSTSGYTAGDSWSFTAQCAVLATTISGFTNSHTVTLTASATKTVPSAGLGGYGTDNSIPINNAITSVEAIGGGTVYFGTGIYLTSTQTLINTPSTILQGISPASSVIMYAGATAITGAVQFSPVNAASVNPGCTIALSCMFFNGANNLTIRGNANSAVALLTIATHHSDFTDLLIADSTIGYQSQFAVDNRYTKVEVTSTTGNGVRPIGFLFFPTVGISIGAPPVNLSADTSACTFRQTIVEGVLGTGWWLTNAFQNYFFGGTSELTGARSIRLEGVVGGGSAGTSKNAFDSIDVEQNGNNTALTSPLNLGAANLTQNQSEFRNMQFSDSLEKFFPQGVYLSNATSGGAAGGLYALTTTGVVYSAIYANTDNSLNIGSVNQIGPTNIVSGSASTVVNFSNATAINLLAPGPVNIQGPNNLSISSKTAGGLTAQMLNLFTDNNLYIGPAPTASFGQLVFRTGGAGTYSFPGLGVALFGGTISVPNLTLSGLAAATGTPSSLCLNGTTVVVNAALTCTVSSRSYKSKISSIRMSTVNELMKLKPVEFAYNDKPDRMRWGFIAEDTAMVNSKLADGYDKDGVARSLDQNAILALVVKTVQEQQREIEKLKKQINSSKINRKEIGPIVVKYRW